MPAKNVSENIWWVGGGSWGGFQEVISAEGSCNVYLIGGDGEYALIDAGTEPGVAPLLENAASAGVPPGWIRRVLLTHSHPDHILGAPKLQDSTSASIAASSIAAGIILAETRDTPFPLLRPALEFANFGISERLEEGDPVNLGPFEFKLMMTPGHIPDAVTLVGEIDGRRVAVTGDTAIGDQGNTPGVVGWLDGHWGSNPRHLLKSIERIMDFNAELMLPGHGFPIEGKGKVKTSLENCRNRLKQLLAISGLNTMMPLDLKD